MKDYVNYVSPALNVIIILLSVGKQLFNNRRTNVLDVLSKLQ
jgi:hypothetical protein